MFQYGSKLDNPAAGAVLVTSGLVTIPRQYDVRVLIVGETGVWARFVHYRSDGTERNSILLPMVGSMLGPLDLCRMYFGNLEYATIEVRGGVEPVVGTLQAAIELV